MANWQRTLRLNPEWARAHDDKFSRHELAALIAKRLNALRPFGIEYIDSEREEIAWRFEDLARDTTLDADDFLTEFNGTMEELWDWGDTKISGDFFNAKKVCWIDTISDAPGIAAESDVATPTPNNPRG